MSHGRSGCWTCRRRHQKCDERKPACWNCRLRGVECGGYGISLGDFTAYSGRKGQMVSRIRRNGPDGDSGDSNTRNQPRMQPQAQINADSIGLLNIAEPISPSQTSESVSPREPDPSFDCNSPDPPPDPDTTPYPAIVPDAIQGWPEGGNQIVEEDQEGLSPQMAMLINELAPKAPPRDPFDQHLYGHCKVAPWDSG